MVDLRRYWRLKIFVYIRESDTMRESCEAGEFCHNLSAEGEGMSP